MSNVTVHDFLCDLSDLVTVEYKGNRLIHVHEGVTIGSSVYVLRHIMAVEAPIRIYKLTLTPKI